MKPIRLLQNVTLIAALTGCTLWTAAVAGGVMTTIEINQASVTPSKVAIHPGDPVLFINHGTDRVRVIDSKTHSVLTLAAHSTLEKTFNQGGAYRFLVSRTGLSQPITVAVADDMPGNTAVLGVQPDAQVAPLSPPAVGELPSDMGTPGFSGTMLTTTSGSMASPAVPSSSFADQAAPSLTGLDAGPLASPAVPSSTTATNPSLETANSQSTQPGLAYVPYGFGSNVYGAPYATDNGLVAQTGTAGLSAGYNPNAVSAATGGIEVAPTSVPSDTRLPAANGPMANSDAVLQSSQEASNSMAVISLGSAPQPASLVIPAGTTVTFIDPTGGQAVASADPWFRSGPLTKGAVYQHTYITEGRYPYALAGGGQGVVIVVPAISQ